MMQQKLSVGEKQQEEKVFHRCLSVLCRCQVLEYIFCFVNVHLLFHSGAGGAAGTGGHPEPGVCHVLSA